MTTEFQETITSERPTDGSGLTDAAEPKELPVLFWAAVILFTGNLLVWFGIWVSPELRVGLYGQDEGLLAGSYAKPSPFPEQVRMAARKLHKPEKVRPIFYQEPEAEFFLPDAATPVASEITAYEVDLPRVTASAARIGDRVRHLGTVEIAPRPVTEQP